MPTPEELRARIEEAHRVSQDTGRPPIGGALPAPLTQAEKTRLAFDRKAHAAWLRTFAFDLFLLADLIDPPVNT